MPSPSIQQVKLSEDIFSALQLALKLHETEVAERLLQALEALAQGSLDDRALCDAYLEMSSTVPR